ncbi:hypothetical protein C8J56DRAFT_1035828, partial [Mycena floridula]
MDAPRILKKRDTKRRKLENAANASGLSETYATFLTPSVVEADPGPEPSSSSLNEDTKKDSLPPKKETQTSKTLKSFMAQSKTLLDYILGLEADSALGSVCRCTKAMATVQCRDCIGYELSCEDCFINFHRHTPYHWAEVWNEQQGYFIRKDISKLHDDTFAIPLGHHGQVCPKTNDKSQSTIFTIIHSNAPDRVAQLMQTTLFPGTMGRPATAFTFAVLRQFHLHHLESKESAYDFCGALRRLTDNAFAPHTQEYHKQFLRVARVWRILTAMKRAGQAHNIDKYFPNRPKGNLVVRCPLCPERCVNLPPNWENIPSEFKHLVQLQLTADGNHHINKTFKNSDPDDISLWDGHGHFSTQAEWKTYAAFVNADPKRQEDEKVPCENLKAMSNQDRKKFRNMEVTGAVNIQCSHVYVWSTVDLQLGERFMNTDFALMRALRLLVPEPLVGDKPALDFLLSYDSNCAYSKHCHSRFQKYLPQYAHLLAPDFVRYTIPLVHVNGHQDDCTYLYAVVYVKNGGHFHGETAEQYWPESNQLGPQTRQMNNGHRQDTLMDHHNDWNWKKTMAMVDRLTKDIQDARAQLISKRDYFLALTDTHDEELLDQWRAMDREIVDRTKKPVEIPSQGAIYQNLLMAEASKPSAAKSIAKSLNTSIADFINEGIHLENLQLRIHSLVAFTCVHHSATVLTEITNRRKALDSRIRSWCSHQRALMPVAITAIPDQNPSDLPETETLFLPSSFTMSHHSDLDLVGLAETEKALREGAAYDSLSDVQSISKTLSNVYLDKQKNDRGTEQNTRSMEKIHELRRKRDTAIDTYNTARKALIALGRIKSDSPAFPPLTVKDTTRASTLQKRAPGSSRVTDGLIWTMTAIGKKPKILSSGAPNPFSHLVGTQITTKKSTGTRQPPNRDDIAAINDEEEYQATENVSKEDGWIWNLAGKGVLSSDEMVVFEEESDRVQWFRAEADYERALEVWETRQAEFIRGIRYFKTLSTTWADIAKDSGEDAGKMAYTKQKSAMYARMHSDAEIAFTNLGYGSLMAEGCDLAAEIAKGRSDIVAALRRYDPDFELPKEIQDAPEISDTHKMAGFVTFVTFILSLFPQRVATDYGNCPAFSRADISHSVLTLFQK